MNEPTAKSPTLAQAPGRVVVIAGRPNVGKSALFNRLARRRVAIVHEESGVTRDRIVLETAWNDQPFTLIDTGGLETMSGNTPRDVISAGIRAQAEAALADAAVVIQVADVTAGVTPLDLEVATLLRKQGCRAVLAVNKADHAGLESAAPDFSRLGFPVFPVSALHNRGVDTLMAAVLKDLPPVANSTLRDPLRVAIVGRPNVGKSSYINRLLRSDRVLVSDIPGTTRDSVDVPFTIGQGEAARHYLLIDTAGMRRVGKIDTAVERFSRMRAEESIARAHIVALVLDATQGPSDQDKKIADLIAYHQRGCVVIVNKWDALRSTPAAYTAPLLRHLPFLKHCPITYVSARTGFNIRQSVAAIDRVAAQTRATLPTGALNRCLNQTWERTPPPTVEGRRFKLFYAVQVGCDPLRLKLFVNDPKRLRPAYREFLLRRLRETFGLEGAAIRLDFTARIRRDKDAPRATADAEAPDAEMSE